MTVARLALAFSLVALAAASSRPQESPPAKAPQFVWPERMANAQVLPADTGPDQLRDTMRGFAMALGVRCTFCHVGPEGAPLSQLDFVSDANPHKEAARGMIRMVAQLNNEILPAIPNLHDPRVSCFTCHRGSARPATAPPAPASAPQPAQAQPHVHGERGAS